jgi:hypothetical protein
MQSVLLSTNMDSRNQGIFNARHSPMASKVRIQMQHIQSTHQVTNTRPSGGTSSRCTTSTSSGTSTTTQQISQVSL